MAQKILVVEDDEFLRELYDELLKGEGYEVTIAVDGEEGLNQMSNGGFDLVLFGSSRPDICVASGGDTRLTSPPVS